MSIRKTPPLGGGGEIDGVEAKLKNCGKFAPRCKSNNKAIRKKLDRAFKRQESLLRRIEDAIECGDLKREHAIKLEYQSSHEVKLAEVCRANKSHLPLKSLPKIAAEINVFKPSKEPLHIIKIAKKSGGIRAICSARIRNKARSNILKALIELRSNIPGNAYYTSNGGMKAAKAKLVKIAEASEQLIDFDIQNYFPSFHNDPRILADRVRIHEKSIENTILATNYRYLHPGARKAKLRRRAIRKEKQRLTKIAARKNAKRKCNRVEACGRGSLAHGHPSHAYPIHPLYMHSFHKHDDYSYMSTGDSDRRGLPQGLPASPIVADTLVAPYLEGLGINYADNIVVPAATLAEVGEIRKTLLAKLRLSHAGSFTIKERIIDLNKGGDVLGMHIKKENRRVLISPTEIAWCKLIQEIWLDPYNERKQGNKINKRKLWRKARSMIAAMPLDHEKRWHLETVLEWNMERLLKGDVTPNGIAVDLHYIREHCGFELN